VSEREQRYRHIEAIRAMGPIEYAFRSPQRAKFSVLTIRSRVRLFPVRLAAALGTNPILDEELILLGFAVMNRNEARARYWFEQERRPIYSDFCAV